MQEQRPEHRKIELTEIPNQIQRIQEQVKELQDVIKEGFPFESFFDPTVIGNLFFGSETRKTIGSDEKEEEVPWTMDGILEEMQKDRREGLVGTRKELAIDTIIAIKSQERFFSATEHPLKNDSANNSAFLLALLERVLSSSDEEVGEHYPVDEPTEEYWTAELLEVIRRTVLKPTTFLLEGYGRSGIHSVPGYEDEEFWGEREKLITDEMKNVLESEDGEDGMDKYHRLEKEREKRALESRSEDEWEKILAKESEYLKGYLRKCIARSLQRAIEIENFAQRLTYNGKRVASEETLAKYQEEVKRAKTLKEEYVKLENFQEVLPWIKKNFGENADFQTILQFLNPIESTPKK